MKANGLLGQVDKDLCVLLLDLAQEIDDLISEAF